jgi:hypothetical protein
MIRLVLAIACSLALAACTTTGVPAIPDNPAAVADSTVKDEQAQLAVELAYKAARLAVEAGVDAGVIRGERATQFAALDRKAYAAVQASRTAYRTANATSYSGAIATARSAVGQLLALTGR